jgi:hypothetical protein
MNSTTIKELKYFEDKVCTIITTSMNRSFEESISREHFVVRVRSVTPDGIWGEHPYNPTVLSYFCINHMISIHQEVELDPKNKDHAKMMNDFEEKTSTKLKGDLQPVIKKMELPIIEASPEPEADGDAEFIDIATLEKLVVHTKRTFDAQDLLGSK